MGTGYCYADRMWAAAELAGIAAMTTGWPGASLWGRYRDRPGGDPAPTASSATPPVLLRGVPPIAMSTHRRWSETPGVLFVFSLLVSLLGAPYACQDCA